jgi:hypothetical protein
MGELRNAKFWSGNFKGRDQLKDSGLDGRVILK